MRVLAIDPGNMESAYLLLEDETILSFAKLPNADMRRVLDTSRGDGTLLAVEMIASYGMAVGATVFDTCVWIGRFLEYWADDENVSLIKRIQVKSHICHSAKAKDGNIRQALIDRYGEQGTKKNPGPTYGIAADVWSALAIATVAMDRLHKRAA
jgi:hypothetical protein